MIPQYEPIFNTPALNTNFVSYFESGGWVTEYKKTEEFEQKISEFIGCKHTLCVNNGTISLSLALKANGVKAGDHVIVPSLSMLATANAVQLIGAIPIFVDVTPINLCLDLKEASGLIKTNRKIKAVIYVSLNGHSHGDKELTDFYNECQYYNVGLIEDAAQSLGSKRNSLNRIGDSPWITSFSFSMPKIITTGQGGCLTTNSDKVANVLRKLKDHGRSEPGSDIHDDFGVNAKFTDMQAIVGLSQMEDINHRVKLKKDTLAVYINELQGTPVTFLPINFDITTPWFMDIYVEERKDLVSYLLGAGIKTRPLYKPMYRHGNYTEIKQCPITERASRRGLWLPSSLTLTEDNLKYICDKIKEYYN